MSDIVHLLLYFSMWALFRLNRALLDSPGSVHVSVSCPFVTAVQALQSSRHSAWVNGQREGLECWPHPQVSHGQWLGPPHWFLSIKEWIYHHWTEFYLEGSTLSGTVSLSWCHEGRMFDGLTCLFACRSACEDAAIHRSDTVPGL